MVKSHSSRQQVITEFSAVRSWFKCDVYPEKHEGEEHEIEEHFYTVSSKTKQISEQDVLQKHSDTFPHHQVIEYEVGRPWHYKRDRYGRRIK